MTHSSFIVHRSSLALLCASLATALSPVQAQQYPARPVRFVVPFAPGGSTDTLARTMGVKLADALGHQVVVDNRPGGNGDIGMLIVARAPADGHTIVLGYIANLAFGAYIRSEIKKWEKVVRASGAKSD